MSLTWKQLKNFVNSLSEEELKKELMLHDQPAGTVTKVNEVGFADEFKIEDLISEDTAVIVFGEVELK